MSIFKNSHIFTKNQRYTPYPYVDFSISQRYLESFIHDKRGVLSMRSIDMRMVVKYTKNTKKGGLH